MFYIIYDKLSDELNFIENAKSLQYYSHTDFVILLPGNNLKKSKGNLCIIQYKIKKFNVMVRILNYEEKIQGKINDIVYNDGYCNVNAKNV